MIAHRTVESDRGICAGGHRDEAEAGAAILRAGGNAVDAGVAAALVGYVVEQRDCGLGGFARISIYCPEIGRSVSIDGYVRAPAAATADMFEPLEAALTYYGHPPTAGDRARHGPLAVATPGAVAALCEAHQRFGRLPLVEVAAPAIEAARSGPAFSGLDVLAIARLVDRIRDLPESAAVLLPAGRLPEVPTQGKPARMDGAALARTLERLATYDADGFYRGPTGRAIAAACEILTEDDLAGVRAGVCREEPTRYRDLSVSTCLDGIGALALQTLDRSDLDDPIERSHRIAEALAVGFTDGPSLEWDGTSQMVAADADGQMISIITAVGWDYGSLVYAADAGCFLNNGMSYFDPRPGRPNSIAPGKAPVFGAPTLVAWDHRGGRLACAGSGGYRIQTAVIHAVVGAIDRGLDPRAALEAPRVHSAGRETVVDDRLDPAVIDGLRERGHEIEIVRDDPTTLHFGRVCLIDRDSATGRLRASASPAHLTAVRAA